MKVNNYIPAFSQVTISWWKLADSTLSVMEVQAWSNEIGNATPRHAFRARALVIILWHLSQQSAALSARFISNAREIMVRYSITGSINQLNMPATDISAFDLYTIDSDGILHCAAAKNSFKDIARYNYSEISTNDNFHKLGERISATCHYTIALEM